MWIVKDEEIANDLPHPGCSHLKGSYKPLSAFQKKEKNGIRDLTDFLAHASSYAPSKAPLPRKPDYTPHKRTVCVLYDSANASTPFAYS